MAKKGKGKDKVKKTTASLPGMEDREIAELQGLALEYAEKRDERMAIGVQEVDLKGKLLAAMKRNHKRSYSYNGVEIDVVTEEETVKVRVKSTAEEGAEG